ncbi:hypothetical protein JG688_00001492 [Phytophthora aleatoria]|uniref:Uncharacterized protein n=1 Tax=Phytophthora aleatoria TaxID=2496075 RepID=A0A8J5J441_9STRA|nr:hypothetical protein JG688_00001492 [Phytophthora aleatoria]
MVSNLSARGVPEPARQDGKHTRRNGGAALRYECSRRQRYECRGINSNCSNRALPGCGRPLLSGIE